MLDKLIKEINDIPNTDKFEDNHDGVKRQDDNTNSIISTKYANSTISIQCGYQSPGNPVYWQFNIIMLVDAINHRVIEFLLTKYSFSSNKVVIPSDIISPDYTANAMLNLYIDNIYHTGWVDEYFETGKCSDPTIIMSDTLIFKSFKTHIEVIGVFSDIINENFDLCNVSDNTLLSVTNNRDVHTNTTYLFVVDRLKRTVSYHYGYRHGVSIGQYVYGCVRKIEEHRKYRSPFFDPTKIEDGCYSIIDIRGTYQDQIVNTSTDGLQDHSITPEDVGLRRQITSDNVVGEMNNKLIRMFVETEDDKIIKQLDSKPDDSLSPQENLGQNMDCNEIRLLVNRYNTTKNPFIRLRILFVLRIRFGIKNKLYK